MLFIVIIFSIREERDSEYAQMIQEEIQRRAEEALRREMEDEVCNTLQAQWTSLLLFFIYTSELLCLRQQMDQ